MQSDLCKTYPLFSFPFWGTFWVGNIGTDFDGADQWGNCDSRDMYTSSCVWHCAWRTIYIPRTWIGHSVCHYFCHRKQRTRYAVRFCPFPMGWMVELVVRCWSAWLNASRWPRQHHWHGSLAHATMKRPLMPLLAVVTFARVEKDAQGASCARNFVSQFLHHNYLCRCFLQCRWRTTLSQRLPTTKWCSKVNLLAQVLAYLLFTNLLLMLRSWRDTKLRCLKSRQDTPVKT